MFNNNEITKDIDTGIYSEMSVSKLPIIGNLKIKTQYLILLILFIISLGFSFCFLTYSLKTDYSTNIIEQEYFNVKKINSTYSGNINNNLIVSNNKSKYNSIINEYVNINKFSSQIIENRNNYLKIDEMIYDLKQLKSDNINTFIKLHNNNELRENNFNLLNIENKATNLIKANKTAIINKNIILKEHSNMINGLEYKIHDYLSSSSYSKNNYNEKTIYLIISGICLLLSFLFLSCMFLVYLFEKDKKQVIDSKLNMEMEATTLKLISELIPFKLNDFSKFVTVSDGLIGSVSSEFNDILRNLKHVLKDVKYRSNNILVNNDYISKWFLDNKNKIYELEESIEKSSKIFSNFSNLSTTNIKSIELIKDKNIEDNDNVNNNIKTNIINKNKNIENLANNIDGLINNLEFKLKDINLVVETISDISEETYVLSSNALINANNNHHDNDNSIKFIINSIKSLSENSNISITQMLDIINMFNSVISEIKQVSIDIKKQVNEITDISVNSIDERENLISSLNNSSPMILELEDNLIKQKILIDTFGEKINDIFVKSKVIISTTKEKDNIIKALEEHSTLLDELVSMVKIGE